MTTKKPTGTWPLDHVVKTQGWGENPAYYVQFGQKGHNGIDLGHNPEGTPIYAVAPGVVEFAGWGGGHNWLGDIAGNTVLIRHPWGYSSYNHQSRVKAKAGQKVTANTVIGYIGSSGAATGPHLHFDTLPLEPNFDNGFSGRVRPSTLITLRERGQESEKITMKSYTPKDTNAKNRPQTVAADEKFHTLAISDVKANGKRSTTLTADKPASVYANVNLRGVPGTTVEVALLIDTYVNEELTKSVTAVTADAPPIPGVGRMVKALVGYHVPLKKGQRVRVAVRVDGAHPVTVSRVGWSAKTA